MIVKWGSPSKFHGDPDNLNDRRIRLCLGCTWVTNSSQAALASAEASVYETEGHRFESCLAIAAFPLGKRVCGD